MFCTNFYSTLFLAFSHYKDVGRFDIAMHYPITVQTIDAIQQLPHQ